MIMTLQLSIIKRTKRAKWSAGIAHASLPRQAERNNADCHELFTRQLNTRQWHLNPPLSFEFKPNKLTL